MPEKLHDPVTTEQGAENLNPEERLGADTQEQGYGSAKDFLDVFAVPDGKVSPDSNSEEDLSPIIGVAEDQEKASTTETKRKEEYKLKREERIEPQTLDGQAGALVAMLEMIPRGGAYVITGEYGGRIQMDDEMKAMLAGCSKPFISKHRKIFSDSMMFFFALAMYGVWCFLTLKKLHEDTKEKKAIERRKNELQKKVMPNQPKPAQSTAKPQKKGLKSVRGVEEWLRKRSNFEIDEHCKFKRRNHSMPEIKGAKGGVIPVKKRYGQWMEYADDSEACLLLVLRDTQYTGNTQKRGPKIGFIVESYMYKYGKDKVEFHEYLETLNHQLQGYLREDEEMKAK